MVGLDLSLSATGVALVDGETVTIKPKPATLRGGERLAFIADALHNTITLTPRLVVIEDYSPGSVGISGKLANAELHGVVTLLLHRRDPGIVIARIKPSALKRWATGNGGAKKPEMVEAAIAAGWRGDPKRHDEADAWHLRALGLQFLTGAGPAWQRELCDGMAWPGVPGFDLRPVTYSLPPTPDREDER